MKAKVKEFDGVIETNFLGNKIPKENKHYACITCVKKINITLALPA